MGLYELLFSKKEPKKKKKTQAELEKEQQEKERKLWEMAEEYEQEE